MSRRRDRRKIMRRKRAIYRAKLLAIAAVKLAGMLVCTAALEFTFMALALLW